MFNSGVPSVADIAAVTGGNGSNGSWGNGEGWWVLIILFALFGWGRNGFGNSGCGSEGACATVGDVQRGFDNQSVINKLNGLENGLCSLGYDQLAQMNTINQNVTNTGYQLQNAIQQDTIASMQQANALQSQLADCCCENRQATAQVRYDLASDTAAIQNQINQCCCDLKQTMNDNTRVITDQLTQFRMEDKNDQIAELRSQVQALNLAQSQANQNTYLLSRLQPTPTPSYQVANPYSAYGCCNAQAASCCC